MDGQSSTGPRRRRVSGRPCTAPDRHRGVSLCQQAAEKALKAFLIEKDTPFAKTHDLDQLVALCATLDPSFSRLSEAAAVLTPYAIAFRYPTGQPDPTKTEAEQFSLARPHSSTLEIVLDAGSSILEDSDRKPTADVAGMDWNSHSQLAHFMPERQAATGLSIFDKALGSRKADKVAGGELRKPRHAGMPTVSSST